MSRCQIKTAKKDEFQIVEFHGHIDEAFMPVANTIPESTKYIFNLKNLVSINSSGIREWILFAQRLKSAAVILTDCPKPFIDQASMVNGFIPENFKVQSFYVPYFNEAADKEKLVLVQFGKEYTATEQKVPNEFTDTDGTVYEIDIIPSKYFKFLNIK
jgi:hypothetical protein